MYLKKIMVVFVILVSLLVFSCGSKDSSDNSFRNDEDPPDGDEDPIRRVFIISKAVIPAIF